MAQTKIYKNGQWVETGGVSSSATYVEYSNTESGLSATNVQTAIDEVASEKVDKETVEAQVTYTAMKTNTMLEG